MSVRSIELPVEPVKTHAGPASSLAPISQPAASRQVRERLDLTRRAAKVMRRHLARALVRISVLLTGDALALLGLRWLLRGVRDLEWFGPGVAAATASLVPAAALPHNQFLPAVLLGLIVLDTYGASDRRRDAGRLVAGATFGLVLPFWSYLWNDFSLYPVPGFALLALATATALTIERHIIDRVVRRLWPVGKGAAHALIIGGPDETRQACDHPALADTREFMIRGVYDPTELRRLVGGSSLSRLCQVIKRHGADTLVLTGHLDNETFTAVLDAASAAGCQVYAMTRSLALGGVEPIVTWRRGAPLVVLTRPGLRGRQLLLKRMVDVVCSALALVVLAPLFAVIALAVRCSSPGPVFFRQRRVGLGGTSFTITKFRSMVMDAEARRDELDIQSVYADRRLFKVKSDPRVTRIGALLRRTSLDELPQLLNVLRGTMSLVGPRPPLPCEVDLYEEHHYTRFDMKPGMTGPWQVNGRNQITDFEEVIRLESAYIREWTIWKDLGIMLKTVPAVFRMNGAH